MKNTKKIVSLSTAAFVAIASLALPVAAQNRTGMDIVNSGEYFRLKTMFRGENECLEGNGAASPVHKGSSFMDDCQNVSGQLWKFEPANDGYFRLKIMDRDGVDCLEGNEAGSPVHDGSAFMDECQNVSGQLWKVVADGNGSDSAGVGSNNSAVEASTPKVSPTIDNIIALRSVNEPARYVQSVNSMGELSTISGPELPSNALFRVVNGLAGGESVSFQSLDDPSRYLRHQGFRVELQTIECNKGLYAIAIHSRLPEVRVTSQPHYMVAVRDHVNFQKLLTASH